MRVIDFVRGLGPALPTGVAAVRRKSGFACGDCAQVERCGQLPSEDCIVRAEELASGNWKVRRESDTIRCRPAVDPPFRASKGARSMSKRFLAALIAAAFLSATTLTVAVSPSAFAEAAKKEKTEKKEKKAEKKLTPQQQKMRDCSRKWNDEKKAKKVSGKKAHNEFMSKCLKGT